MTPSILALNRATDDDHTRRRIVDAIVHHGARSIGFVAHHAGTTYNTARNTLRDMLAEGYFKVIDLGGTLHCDLAAPGDPAVEPDLYCAIITAIRGGARTTDQIADQIGLPPSTALRYAIALTIRLAYPPEQP